MCLFSVGILKIYFSMCAVWDFQWANIKTTHVVSPLTPSPIWMMRFAKYILITIRITQPKYPLCRVPHPYPAVALFLCATRRAVMYRHSSSCSRSCGFCWHPRRTSFFSIFRNSWIFESAWGATRWHLSIWVKCIFIPEFKIVSYFSMDYIEK